MADVKLSIIIPSYNSGRYLVGTLATIAKQDYAPYEVIVVDGASTDETRRVVEAYGTLVTTFISEPDAGQLDAVGKGIRVARGDVLNWMNADDIVMPGAYRAVADAFATHPETEIVFSDEYVFTENCEVVHAGARVRRMNFWDQFLFLAHMPSECVYWRREISEQGFPLDTSMRTATDVSFLLPLQYARKARWIPSNLAAFRTRHDQASARFSERTVQELETIVQRMCDRLSLTREDYQRLRSRRRPGFLLRHQWPSRLYSAARFLGRKITNDRRRRDLARFLTQEWLQPPQDVIARLRSA
jgi:glycosyltransferase involved in cell wall biosynthesis